MIEPDHIRALEALAGDGGSTTDPDLIAPHVREWRDKYVGATPILLTPKKTETVSQILAYCHAHTIAVVPQGGNTGLVGGGIPGLNGRSEVLLSLKKMNGVGAPDPASWTIEAEAGATISAVQHAAAKQDFLFPLSLASEGSCTVGGTIATNAGGIHVIRYGSMRARISGLECVLADGTVLNLMAPLVKDNTGYDLKSLIAGSEGTLGVVTRARLKLAAAERVRATAWIAADSLDKGLTILHRARGQFAETLSAFEAVSSPALGLALVHIDGARAPVAPHANWHFLLELGASDPNRSLDRDLETWLAELLEGSVISDAALAQSEQQRAQFWALREGLSEAQKAEGVSVKHDIALPLNRIAEFCNKAIEVIADRWPTARPTPFGHLGDGNLHFNIMQGRGEDGNTFREEWDGIQKAIHALVTDFGGSISAEHGIGTMKCQALHDAKPQGHMAQLKALKQALDPKGILNPGVFFGE